MSNFAFLAAEFPAVHEAAVEAERQVELLLALVTYMVPYDPGRGIHNR
jgi:hypothetical protein